MTGAVLTHVHGGDSAPNYGPPLLLAGAAVAVLVEDGTLTGG